MSLLLNHSKYTPEIKINKKIDILNKFKILNKFNTLANNGKSKAISTSKIKNIRIKRKNWIEIGTRADLKVLNPHSKEVPL